MNRVPRRPLLLLLVLVLALVAPGAAIAQPPPPDGEAPEDEPAAEPERYEPTAESLAQHPVPDWFDDAKFGVFIHWGPYSVPAYAPAPDAVPVGGFPFTFNFQYSEWYWNHMSQPSTPQWQHHLSEYGQDFNYDDFLDEWRAEQFDPDEWVDLFNDAGAQYFVLVSKHHDGFALWPSDTTNRDSGAMGPRRDLVGELFDAAREDGNLHAGLYYSVYEWYHPQYRGINDSGMTLFNGPTTGPYNPYTGQPIPYYGYVPVEDYVEDHQVPQMRELMERYQPAVLWCDGAWDNSEAYWRAHELIAEYYNRALERQPDGVVVNNRCGNGAHSDFSTPEYTSEAEINPNKWEATRGIGFSFGYNQFEDELQYLTANQIVDSLVDIVSKNGNFLLNIGPRADGTIIALMQQRLRDVGQWLEVNGEAIYGTTYWETFGEDAGAAPQVPLPGTVGDSGETNVGAPGTPLQGLRFTVANKAGADAFYITSLSWPEGEELVVDSDVPIEAGDEVRLLGWDQPLQWTKDEGGPLRIALPEGGQAVTDLRNAFTFRIAEPGYVAPDLRPRPTPLPERAERDRVVRHAGADRTGTAAAVSGEVHDTAETVVVARADAYADALAGGPLAAHLDAPLLLTGGDGLGEAAANEIARVGATEAVLLGGTGALSPQVEADLREQGLEVRRVAGANRFATAAAIAAELPDTDEVVIAEGENADPARGWPDALSASGLASVERLPVLLVNRDRLPEETAAALDQGVDVTIVGGPAAVGEAVAGQVDARAGTVRRLAGADRYATSVAVAEEALARGHAGSHAWLATGTNWPDGLVSGAAAGTTDGVLLLVDGTDLAASPGAASLLSSRSADLERVHLVGGTAAIGQAVEASVRQLLSAG